MSPRDKPLVWLHGNVRTPPFSIEARIEAGFMLRQLQSGEKIGLPHSRPMPAVGPNCHELRVRDKTITWRLIYRIDEDAIVLAEVFKKKTARTPGRIIATCKNRLKDYDDA